MGTPGFAAMLFCVAADLVSAFVSNFAIAIFGNKQYHTHNS